MRKRLTWLGQLVVALIVVGGLSFGARTAMAGNRDDCQPCYNDFECDDCCIREYGLPGTCFEAQQACLCG